MLDAALDGGVDWIDTARSYGRAEEFVGQWWRARSAADPDWLERAPTVSSKWGYAYVGDWNPDADVHEVKDHSLAQFEAQWALTRDTLPRVNLYQVHSLTLDSPLFTDGPCWMRWPGYGIPASPSASRPPAQGRAIPSCAAMEVDRGGRPAVLRRAVDLEPAGDQCCPGSAGGLPPGADRHRQGGARQRPVVTDPPAELSSVAEPARRQHRCRRPGRGGDAAVGRSGACWARPGSSSWAATWRPPG